MSVQGKPAPQPRVLIADDDPAVLEVLCELMRAENYQVFVATGGTQACELCDMLRFDLIVADLVMPDMDAVELITHLRAQGQETPVLVVSGHDSYEAMSTAWHAGATDFLTKGFSRAQLQASLARLRNLDPSEAPLLSRLTEECRRFSSLCTPANLEQVLDGLLPPQGSPGAPGWYGLSAQAHDEVAAALKEALLNAFYHGHKCATSKPTTIILESNAEALTVTVADQGPGFDHEQARTSRKMGGLSLILAVMDEVRWNAAGNEITMVKLKR